MRKPIRGWNFAVAIVTVCLSPAYAGDGKLAIHEWGTFTSLQDEAGAAIGGINTDDEPVPGFVHHLSRAMLLARTELPQAYSIYDKGLPVTQALPEVTMRLETPVLYFHPADPAGPAQEITVKASFHGGWLSEFYPNAKVEAPGVSESNGIIAPLRSSTTGTLSWENLLVGGPAAVGAWTPPATDAHVWSSPRAVDAAPVRAAAGEMERFLFYRGVGHLDAPLRVSREGQDLVLRSQLDSGIGGPKELPLRSLWLVDIQPDGRVAFRTLPAVRLAGGDAALARTQSHFKASDYAAGNLDKLKESLREGLVADGLFGDEADALLNTWEVSYFKSSGTRLFFLAPQSWTDSVLPLEVSVPAEIRRVMVGRIEIVTTEQREILREIAQMNTNSIKSEADAFLADISAKTKAGTPGSDMLTKVADGTMSLAQISVKVPKAYGLYLRLGRFRNALLLNESSSHKVEGLNEFILAYGLQGFKLPVRAEAALQSPYVADNTARQNE